MKVRLAASVIVPNSGSKKPPLYSTDERWPLTETSLNDFVRIESDAPGTLCRAALAAPGLSWATVLGVGEKTVNHFQIVAQIKFYILIK